ncbi:MAG TPA: zinc-dependent metalloprotease [Fimbriimonadaceae bacterium]|nr:zinc-dependent metalloprotease [Fimbriimonadaceae bacterium]
MIRSSFTAIAFAFVFSSFLVSPAWGQAAGPSKTPAKDQQKEEPKHDPETVAYENAVKDLTRINGPIPIYIRKKEVLVELSEGQLNKTLMCETTLASGISQLPYQAGDPVGDNEIEAYRLEKKDDQVWLVEPNLAYRWDKKDPLAIASERSLPEAVLAGYRIEQTDPEKKRYLVNMSSFFYGDVNQLNELVNQGVGGQYVLDREKSGIDRAKGFPDNTIVRMQLHYFSAHGAQPNPLMELLGLTQKSQLEDSRSVPLKVTYNLWMRKDDGYVPRLSDPRIGYFTEDFYSLARFLKDDRTERYIDRWNLVKRDPNALLSDPVKPIVFTLDPSIPKEYRPAIKEGILRWNKAFEAIGFKDAVQVQEVPDNDKDYDHADGRYNVIRWAMTPDAGYAVSNIRTDPFTGEILNASVTVDANMAYYIVQEHQKISTPEANAMTRAMSVFTRDSKRDMPVDAYLWDYDKESLRRQAEKIAGKYGLNHIRCDLEEGLADDAAFAYTEALATGIKINKEDYVKKYLSSVVCHEVGHCLGLRHNFVASTYLSTAQLADDALTSRDGLSASVMDYNPVNVQAILHGSGNFYMPTIGPYDDWAIQYGYMPFAGVKEPEDEKSRLNQIAARSGEPGHAYMTDESADDWDPYVVRFDAAKDPVSYAEKEIEASRRAIRYALTNLPRPGESYSHRTDVLLRAINGIFKEGRFTARFVGGVTGNRNFRGDDGERQTLKPVDSSTQRAAVQLIVRSCLAQGSFALPADAMTNLSQDMNLDRSASWDAPMRQIISMQQDMLYAMLTSADTTDRIAENSYKLEGQPGAYSLSEHYGAVLSAVFSEIGQNKPVGALRRDLQRFALAGLMTQAGASQGQINTDVRMIASDSLRRLRDRYAAQLKAPKGLDDMTLLYLRDSKETIDRFLSRQATGK